MRLCVCVLLLASADAVLAAAPPHAGEGRAVELIRRRIEKLIEQLGDDDFKQREAAGRSLEALGELSLAPLRKAAATSEELEVRRRAKRLAAAIAARAGKNELARWAGTWQGEGSAWMKFDGEGWASGTRTFGPVSGKVRGVEVMEKFVAADLVVEQGPTAGGMVKAIFRRDGDTLHYCGTYGSVRPTKFANEAGFYYMAFKRTRKQER